MRDTEISCERGIVMVEERTENQELMAALDNIQGELKGIKKKGAKQVFQIIVAVILTLAIGLGAGVVCGRHWDDIMFKLFPNSYSASTTKKLEDTLKKQAKLNTGIYTQIATYDSGKMYANKLSEKLRMNGKSMSFTFTGYVEAGIKNLADVKININSKTNVITIDNIKISITNVYIDPSSIKDAKQTKNIFNQLTIGDFASAQSELEKKLNRSCSGERRCNTESALRRSHKRIYSSFQLAMISVDSIAGEYFPAIFAVCAEAL